MLEQKFAPLYERMDYEFKRPELLQEALTRPSAVNEMLPYRKDCRRLAHLGDGVLELVIRDSLFANYADWSTGSLTQKKSELVNNKGPLAEVAKKLRLGRFLQVGVGEESIGIRENTKALSDAMEAVIGALWLDSNKDFLLVQSFILKQWTYVDLLPEPKGLSNRIFKVAGDYFLKNQHQELVGLLSQPLSLMTIDCFLTEHAIEDKQWMALTLSKRPSKKALNEALISPVIYQDADVIELLLKNKANPNTLYDTRESDLPRTPLEEKGRFSVLQLAVMHHSSRNGCRIIQLLVDAKANINWNKGVTVYEKRTFREHVTEAIAPIAEMINPALSYSDDGGFGSVDLSTFLRDKRHEHQRQLIEINNQQTVLHIACMQDYPKKSIISSLLSAKADPNIQNYEGDTALHALFYCCEALCDKLKLPALIQQFLDNGYNAALANKKGNTPLHLLFSSFIEDQFEVEAAALEISLLLLKAGAAWDARNAQGKSARELAKRKCFFNYALWKLLDLDINSCNQSGLASAIEKHWMIPAHPTWRLWLVLADSLQKNQTIIGLIGAYLDPKNPRKSAHRKAIEYGLLLFDLKPLSPTPARALRPSAHPVSPSVGFAR